MWYDMDKVASTRCKTYHELYVRFKKSAERRQREMSDCQYSKMLLSLQPVHPEKVQRLADECGFDEAWLKKPVKVKATKPKKEPLALTDGQPPPAMQHMVLNDGHCELPAAPSKAPPAMPNPAQPNLLIDGSPAAIAAREALAAAPAMPPIMEARPDSITDSTPPPPHTEATPAQPKPAGATPAQPSVRNVLQQLAAASMPDEARDRIAANREAALARRRMRQAQDIIDLVLVWKWPSPAICIYLYIHICRWCLELAIIIFDGLYIYGDGAWNWPSPSSMDYICVYIYIDTYV